MIDSVKIDLLGDIFEIFSLGADEKNPEDLKTNAENICVFLYPSLAADFSVKAYSRVKENYCDYYAAALIAAAFLIDRYFFDKLSRCLAPAVFLICRPAWKEFCACSTDNFVLQWP